jgi:elongation factor Ts
MTAISAATVKELRDLTGQAMMDCKKALTETDGDIEKAVVLLRKKGMAVMEKRGGRETKEGQVLGKVSDNGKKAAIVMLCSETDFTSKNDDFQSAVKLILDVLLSAGQVPQSEEALLGLEAANGKKVAELINDIVSKTGEKITLGNFAGYELNGSGLLHVYIHFNGKIGTILQLDADKDITGKESVATLASDLAMHITAVNPLALSRDDIVPELIAKEKEVAAEQVKGKPANMIEKIVEGKLSKWYQQVALLEQPFVKDDKKTVKELLSEVSKETDTTITLKRFARLQIG